jgi:SAM-dependent MidA family methyltransferase
MQRALYGPAGFYARGSAPSHHFRTAPHTGRQFAEAMLRIACEVDASLGHPARFDIVDMGAGSGELATQICELAADTGLAGRVSITAVDVHGRPVGLADAVTWTLEPPALVSGLVIANEWLDNVPVDVVVVCDDGRLRQMLVDEAGNEQVGDEISPADADWLEQWWPLTGRAAGARAESGASRDEAWRGVIGRLEAGAAVAIDYAHTKRQRADGRFAAGSLAAYRKGMAVDVIPDGSCDITAHVALDACEAAGLASGVEASLLTTQRRALGALGVDEPRAMVPTRAMASADPLGYLDTLASRGEAAELCDPDGLGGFGWLVQCVGLAMPRCLRDCERLG